MQAAKPNALDFVLAIEDAVTDLVQLNSRVTKIYQVTDKAGRSIHDLSAQVERYWGAGQWDLIDRLAEAFLKLGLAPKCITRALENSPASRAITTAKEQNDLSGSYIDSQPLHLERSLPKAIPNPKPQIVNAEVLAPEPEDQEIQTLTTVLKLLKRLPMLERRRVADQAYRYAGMGE